MPTRLIVSSLNSCPRSLMDRQRSTKPCSESSYAGSNPVGDTNIEYHFIIMENKMNPTNEVTGMTQELVMLDEKASFESKPTESVKVPVVKYHPKHQKGQVHKVGDKTYVVSESGAWNRVEPRKSRKRAHRLEVASR